VHRNRLEAADPVAKFISTKADFLHEHASSHATGGRKILAWLVGSVKTVVLEKAEIPAQNDALCVKKPEGKPIQL